MYRITTFAVAAALTLAACAGAASDDALTAADGDSVDVHYVLTLDSGEVIDSSRERGTPLTFQVGSGQVIVGFDDAVRGASVGDVLDVTIAPEDGYGLRDETNTTDLPIAPSQDDIKVGDSVFLSNGQEAVVLAINDDIATVDLNHRLAGETLYFEIEVLAITRG
jgi:FKBP-type peptidyl-prolyl cis-trans isomerase 2